MSTDSGPHISALLTLHCKNNHFLGELITHLPHATIGYVMHPVRDTETGEVLPNRYRLILPSQIGSVECDLPTILIASEAEVPRITLD